MRAREKAMWVVLALTGLLLLHGQAYALSIGEGKYHTKFNSAEALYTCGPAGCPGPASLGTLVPSAGVAAIGDVLRGISVLNAFQFHPGHLGVPASTWDSSIDEVSSIFYDLAVSRVTPIAVVGTTAFVEIGFVPAGFFAYADTNVQAGSFAVSPALGFGGHNDLYLDTKPPLGLTYTAYSDAPGSSAFGVAGAAKHSAAMAAGDAYPGINGPLDSDTLLTEAVFAPLPAALMVAGGGCAACVAGEVFNSQLQFSTVTGIITGGTGKGFLNIIGGPLGPAVLPGGIPADVLANYDSIGLLTPAMAAALGFDASLEIKFGAPASVTAPATAWLASNEDPIHFTVVPEPTSMLLFGTMLVGLGAAGRRRLRRRPN